MITVLEVGGTHVTSALVDLHTLRVAHQVRVGLDSSAPAEAIIDKFATAVRRLGREAGRHGVVVAIPGPFDYANGVGDFEGVAKFGALTGVPLGELLSQRLGSRVQFLNDVTAYALGQYELLGRPQRLVTMTLGTGVGSCFLHDGVPVTDAPSVPPHGWFYLLQHDGLPLEETFSRRALVAEYERVRGERVDVGEIANLARRGDDAARKILRDAFTALADTVAPWLRGFGAQVLVIGGTVATSWDLVEEWFEPAFLRHFPTPPTIRPGLDGESAALLGAARFAADQSPTQLP